MRLPHPTRRPADGGSPLAIAASDSLGLVGSRRAAIELCQESLKDGERECYFSNSPPDTPPQTLVEIASGCRQ
jgi:hypothetical protein